MSTQGALSTKVNALLAYTSAKFHNIIYGKYTDMVHLAIMKLKDLSPHDQGGLTMARLNYFYMQVIALPNVIWQQKMIKASKQAMH